MRAAKHCCQGSIEIAEIAGAIGFAHGKVSCGCRRRARRSSADSRLVFTGAAGQVSGRPSSTGAAAIRIASERKWPEKIVLDTSQPTFFPPSIDVASARDLVDRLLDDRMDQPVVAAQADTAAKPDVRPVVAEHPPVRARHRRSRQFHRLVWQEFTVAMSSPEVVHQLVHDHAAPTTGRTSRRRGAPTYVVRRLSMYFFQIRPPRDLAGEGIPVAPIRVRLGVLAKREAHRRAVWLGTLA